jgi:DNA (cytosine-5)-methyltransferase 1
VNVLDLFAGPGGWDVGARALGIDPVGVEWDENACKTREAAGLRTIKGDVARFAPEPLASLAFSAGWTPTTVDGLIASPPCQSFSMAGKRGGEQDTEHVIDCARELAAGQDTRAEHRAKCEDERSMLVVEPIRWVRDLRPRWVALEQVPPVIGLWSLFAQILGTWGYKTWTGVLSAERYGVPQTRKRAILLASLDFQPEPPTPTHQAYVPGEPQRHDVTMFGEVLPWVSMAQALGWDEGVRACRLARGEGMLERRGQRPDTGDRVWTTERPSTTVNGDPRIFEPGWRGAPEDYAEDGTYTGKRAGDNAIRVSTAEASILQSFAPDYPWQGSRSSQFQQIGNAVPPLLAQAILAQFT